MKRDEIKLFLNNNLEQVPDTEFNEKVINELIKSKKYEITIFDKDDDLIVFLICCGIIFIAFFLLINLHYKQSTYFNSLAYIMVLIFSLLPLFMIVKKYIDKKILMTNIFVES